MTAMTTQPSGAKAGGTIPTRFVPRFWADADRRVSIIRAIEDRVERMKADTGADSYQKIVLAERAVFLLTILETQERDAIEGTRPLDAGGYVQAVNSLIGIFRALGLERHVKQVGGLTEYMEGKKA